MYTNMEPGMGRKQCGPIDGQDPVYCNAFVGCCGSKCCTTEDLTFIFVWAGLAAALILLISCLICMFKKRRNAKTVTVKGNTAKQNMASVYNVVLVNEKKAGNPKVAGRAQRAAAKAQRADVRPLLRVSESSTDSEHQCLNMLKTVV